MIEIVVCCTHHLQAISTLLALLPLALTQQDNNGGPYQLRNTRPVSQPMVFFVSQPTHTTNAELATLPRIAK